MKQLLLLNLGLIVVITIALIIVKKFAKSEKAQNIILIVAALFTVFCHYSSLVYHHVTDGKAMEYLKHNPNLILPIYPCNVVMWSAVIYGFLKNKQSKFASFLCDYLFYFGIVSTLVGMLANVDFIRNPTLENYDITKGIVSHATLLFNVLLLAVFKKVKIDLKSNMIHIIIAIVMMFVIGLYCNLVFEVLVSEKMAYQVNSMFIIHAPFDGVDFLTYPAIAGIALPLYFIVFNLCELFAYKKGERWIGRYFKKKEQK